MKIGIVGFGHLGRALADGLVRSGSCDAGDMYVCETSSDAQALAENEPYNAHVSTDVNYVIKNADIIFLVLKGLVFEEISPDIDLRGLGGKTVVSFMAGVTLDNLYSLFGADVANAPSLVIAMPSLCIAVCDGVIGYSKAPSEVVVIFEGLGVAIETEPENIGRFTAFSGCGPGFAAYLIGAFADAGIALGFSPEESAKIAALTFRFAIDRGNFKETVKAVATPGGATEQGVLHMDKHNVGEIISTAVHKAYERFL